MTGVRGIGRGGEGGSRGVVGRYGCERGTKGGITFEVPEELNLVGAVGCGGISILGAKVDDFLAAVVAEGCVEQ